MACQEIVIECHEGIAPYLSELLWGLEGVEGVMEDYKDEVLLQVKAITPVDVDGTPTSLSAIEALLLDDPMLLEGQCRIKAHRVIEDEEWAESWKQYWHVQSVTDQLTIRPTWEPYEASRPGEIVLDLDPGSAFGTGTHATTRLMLQTLEGLSRQHTFSNMSVLDVGTGSGILAIYAAKLGSHSVIGLDNDPMATRAARENVTQNQVSSQVTILDTPLEEMCLTKYNLLLANIIAPVILELFPQMLQRLERNGIFVASGLIETSVGSVAAAMESAGFRNIERFQQGDWFALHGIYQP